MEARKEKLMGWRQSGVSALVLIAGVFVDNALGTSARMPLVGQVVAIIGGLVVGSLTVLTFRQRDGAYMVTAAVYSALTVIAFTLTLPRVEYVALLALCIATVAACLVSSRPRTVMAQSPVAIRLPTKTRDNRR